MTGPALRRYLPAETAFFLLAWFAVAAVFHSRGFQDPGTLWHVRVGELVLQNGIMRTDPFTFTFAGQTWIPQQWGGEVLMALAHGIGGLDTLLLGFSLLIATTFTLVFRLLRIGGMGLPLAGTLAGFAMVAAGFHFYIRPHLATIAFSAILMAVLVAFDRGRIPLKALIWLAPLHVAWTNIHGGMLGGVATLGLAALGWGTLFLLKKDPPLKSWRSVGALAAIVLLCGLAMFVNPIGLELQRTWFRIVGSGAMAKYVTEHSPLNPMREGDRAVLAFALLYLVLLCSAPRREWRVTWLLPIAWFLLTLKGIRHGPLFVVFAAVAIADIWPRSRIFEWLSKFGDSLTRNPNVPLDRLTWRAIILPATFVALALVLQANRVPLPLLGHGWARLDSPNTMPLELVGPLQDYAKSVPPGTPIYNDLNFGGFTIYFAPTLKIFADDRFELCGDDWLEEYVQAIANHPERIDEWQRRHGFTHALIAASEPLEMHMLKSGRWAEVARGRTAVLLRMKGER
jgi:hypothetical protein